MWTWRPLPDPITSEALVAPMKALEHELKSMDKTMSVNSSSTARTTDATVTTLHTAKIPVNVTIFASGYVVARRTGGSGGSANDGAGYRVEFVAKNTAGTAALIGSGTVTVVGESQVGWDCTLTASSGNILVQVTGAVNNNVTWVGSFKTLSSVV